MAHARSSGVHVARRTPWPPPASRTPPKPLPLRAPNMSRPNAQPDPSKRPPGPPSAADAADRVISVFSHASDISQEKWTQFTRESIDTRFARCGQCAMPDSPRLIRVLSSRSRQPALLRPPGPVWPAGQLGLSASWTCLDVSLTAGCLDFWAWRPRWQSTCRAALGGSSRPGRTRGPRSLAARRSD